MWIGEHYTRRSNNITVRLCSFLGMSDHITNDPSLVFAIVCQQTSTVCVPNRIKPVAVYSSCFQRIVDLNKLPRFKSNTFKNYIECPRTATRGDKNLVSLDLIPAARNDHFPVYALNTRAIGVGEHNNSVLLSENLFYVFSGERLFS